MKHLTALRSWEGDISDISVSLPSWLTSYMPFFLFVWFFLQTRHPHQHVSWRTVRRLGYLMSLPAPLNMSFLKHTKTTRGQNTRWVKGWIHTLNKWHSFGFLGLPDKKNHHFLMIWKCMCILLSAQAAAAPLQTPSELKDEDEGPLQVDSSSPGSPDSSSSMSDNSGDSRVRGKVRCVVLKVG